MDWITVYITKVAVDWITVYITKIAVDRITVYITKVAVDWITSIFSVLSGCHNMYKQETRIQIFSLGYTTTTS